MHCRLFAPVTVFFYLLFFGVFCVHGTESKSAGGGVTYELIGQYDVARLNKILTTETEAFSNSVAVTYTPARNAVRLYRVTYPSIIPEQGNRPTMASGLVAIPEIDGKDLPLVSYQHGTVFGKQEVPSFPEESFETRLMIAQFAGQGYVVIGADYFGMGTSKENEGYIVMDSHRQACMDMLSSARAVLESEQIRTRDFFISGWSQGGLVTVAFLEGIENTGIPVRAASTASAPCDPFTALNGFLNFPREIDAPWTSLLYILSAFSFEEYYGIPGLAQALFNPEQFEIARKVYLREPVTEKEFPTDLHKLIRKEYFNPQYFRKSAYGRLMAQIQPYRRVIQTPLRMYYGEADEAVTVGHGSLPAFYQQSMGNRQVEALSAGANANHRGTFIYAVAQWKLWFDSLIGEQGAAE